MVQQKIGRSWQAEARREDARQLFKNIQRLVRRKFTDEEKTRIILEGSRRDISIKDLCRREGIQLSTYYAWRKDIIEVGAEVQDIKRENARLKRLVAELSLQVNVLKRNGHNASVIKGRYARVGAREKSEIIASVTGAALPCRTALARLGLSRSTYYRWLKRQTEGRLEDRKRGSRPPC